LGVILGTLGAGDAVHRPGGHIVWFAVKGEVAPVVTLGVVPVPRGEDVAVPVGVCAKVLGDPGGDRGTPIDPECAALGEVVLHIDDEECRAHESSPTAQLLDRLLPQLKTPVVTVSSASIAFA